MITQEQFNEARGAIARLRDKATEVRHLNFRNPKGLLSNFHHACGEEHGLSQALAILGKAGRGKLERPTEPAVPPEEWEANEGSEESQTEGYFNLIRRTQL